MTDSSSPTQPPSEAEAVPTCFRHPKRETYVRCVRCDRPICPDCMVQASVGFHCVECVAKGNREVRQARTPFGGKPTTHPYVTWGIIGLILVGFVVQQLLGGTVTARFSMWGGGLVYNGQWERLLTSAFLHANIMHLLFNGFAMYLLGPPLERWLGHVRFLALWVLSAVGGSVLSALVDPAQASVGASGAIFGIFGAILILGRRMRLDIRFVVGLLVVNLLITFLVPGIAWTAHIGGLASGIVLAAAYAYLPVGVAAGDRGRAQTITHTAAVAGYALVLAAILVWWLVALTGA
ncbi:rhomboid family intramembrane serine protease [Salinactinospora qingdaonensis]|uniref:Rhomboid family intramembrane serine protease n=1 Tax=Salinactinospora qingdaonensis TaxID=702744 RepID=A0ABP7FIB2_9ACTN